VKRILILVAIMLIIAMALLPGSWESVSIGRALLFGWVSFIGRVVPRVEVSWVGVVSGAVFLGLLIVLLHLFARWCAQAAADPSAPPRHWRFRWTLSIVTALVLMFIVGYSTIGLARHIGWLCSSPDPLFETKVIYPFETSD
jgi:hypothetical protein